jgi:hypothetical protein
MDYLSDIIAKLPKDLPAAYNGMAVSEPHYERLKQAHIHDGPTLLQKQGYTYAGIRVIPNAAIPEGFAVVTLDDKPVGIIDFAAGTATLTKPDHG